MDKFFNITKDKLSKEIHIENIDDIEKLANEVINNVKENLDNQKSTEY